jgi:hypothetical protein
MPFAITKLLILNGHSLPLRQLTQHWRNSPAPNAAETPAYATSTLENQQLPIWHDRCI